MSKQLSAFNIRHLGVIDYETTFKRMQAFTVARTAETADEIWLLEHQPVYTLGLGAREGHVHQPGDIAVIKTDRGGQVTYHGPGQLIVYILTDLKRYGYGVRSLVSRIEQALINYLAMHGLEATRQAGAPGVYVAGAKIAALGLRLKNSCSYHGLALNVDMDLTPFNHIDPCGYPGLAVTRLKDFGINEPLETVAEQLVMHLIEQLQCETEFIDSHPPMMETVAHD